MTKQQLQQKLNELRSLPAETEVVEFKEAKLRKENRIVNEGNDAKPCWKSIR